MQQLDKWNQELEKLSQKEFKKTDSELFNVYRQSLIDIKKKLYNYTQAYPNLSFSSRLEVERLFHVADEISAVLDAATQNIEETIKNHSSSQAEQGYYGTWYALEQSQNIQLGMPLINHDYVEMLVNKPVDGTRLSKRLYKHRDELAKNVSHNIIEGLFAGDSYAKIAKRVSEQTEASYRQSLRIAITEAGRTNSEASQLSSERAQSLGIDMEKRWLATLDAKTRDSHQELDGQTVPIDGKFEINGHSAKQPRMFAVASEDIRCRCTTINIVNGIAPELRKDNETGEMVLYSNYNDWLEGKKDRTRPESITPEYTPQQLQKMMAWKDPNINEKLGIEKPNFKELDFFEMADFQTDSDNWVAGLETSQVTAMKDYTSDAFAKMNKILRNNKYNPKENTNLQSLIQNLDDALSKFELKHDIITYRGVSAEEYEAILNGEVFKDFKSTSLSKEIAEKFLTFSSKNKGGHVIRFNIPKGTKGAYIGTNSSMKKENEFLLNRDSKYTAEIVDDILEVTIYE